MEQDKVYVVVDMLYDFIDGTMACQNAENAVNNTIENLQNKCYSKIIYICDSHPSNHSSFKSNGGIWPSHCVTGSRGAEIHKAFYNLSKINYQPSKDNIFRKGENKDLEQYSGFSAKNNKGEELSSLLKSKNIVISGIASEYCVFETIKDLLSIDCKIELLESGLAYVDYNGHLETLNKIKELGVVVL